MKRSIFYSIVFILFFIGSINVQGQGTSGDVGTTGTVKDGIFIHITEGYNDPHKVLMPLKMAELMANDKDVVVYLDIHAVELVLKSSKDLTFAEFEPMKKMLQSLIDKKVGIYVCPTCLKVSGHSKSDLMTGVELAQKDKFFNFTNGRIITIDY